MFTRDRRWLAIGAMAATLVAPWLVLQLAPATEFGQSICPHKMLTGFPCPGCGITRSIMSLYRGDVGGSLAYHAFGIPLVLACATGIALLATELATGRTFSRALLFDRRIAGALALILGGYHVARLCQFLASHDLDSILRESIWR